jgi:hypothetical protein
MRERAWRFRPPWRRARGRHSSRQKEILITSFGDAISLTFEPCGINSLCSEARRWCPQCPARPVRRQSLPGRSSRSHRGRDRSRPRDRRSPAVRSEPPSAFRSPRTRRGLPHGRHPPDPDRRRSRRSWCRALGNRRRSALDEPHVAEGIACAQAGQGGRLRHRLHDQQVRLIGDQRNCAFAAKFMYASMTTTLMLSGTDVCRLRVSRPAIKGGWLAGDRVRFHFTNRKRH